MYVIFMVIATLLGKIATFLGIIVRFLVKKEEVIPPFFTYLDHRKQIMSDL